MTNDKTIWAYLLHVSTNMWYDRAPERFQTVYRKTRGLSPKLLFDENVYNEWINRMTEIGMNMVILDVGDAVKYPSHPELAIEGSWTPERMRNEVRRLKARGIEAIPKLNFSTAHDSWLKDYHKMVATPEYYKVCEDLIRDIAEIFDHPRFIHLGYDEESPNQKYADFVVCRQGEHWWKDFLKITGYAEKAGMRPWVWADYGWRHPEEFLKNCPKSVLLSNWYYGANFTPKETASNWYRLLDKAGYDQVVCGSNWGCQENMRLTCDFARRELDPKRLKGFMIAPWHRTLPRYRHMAANSFDIMDEVMTIDRTGKQPPVAPAACWLVKDGQIQRWYHEPDRMTVNPGERLMIDFGRTGKFRAVLEEEGAAEGTQMTVLPSLKMDGTLCAQGQTALPFTLPDGEVVLTAPEAREFRFLEVSGTKRFTITLARATV